MPHFLGVADQGDFERVMTPVGIIFPPNYDFYKFVYFWYPLTSIPSYAFLLPSHYFLILITRLLCQLFMQNTFSLPLYTIIITTLYCLALSLNLSLFFKNFTWKFFVAFALAIFIFLDGNTLMWFGSLYGEPIAFIGILFAIFSFLLCAKYPKSKWSLLLFFAANLLALCSKLQMLTFLPISIIFGIYLIWQNRTRLIPIILCLAIFCGYAYGYYNITGLYMNHATVYQSLTTGILQFDPHPETFIQKIGLDERILQDIDKNAYLPADEYSFISPLANIEEADAQIFSKISNGTIIMYYLTHPSTLIKGLEYTSKEALNSSSNLGHYANNYPFSSTNNRWTLWSNFRAHLSGSLLFFIILALFIITVIILLFKKKKEIALSLFALFYVAVVQFVMPFIFNGTCDTQKQLLIFNFTFDILIFLGILTFIINIKTICVNLFNLCMRVAHLCAKKKGI